MEEITVTVDAGHINLIDERQAKDDVDSRSTALQDILDEYQQLRTEYDDLREAYKDVQTRLESREERIDELEEELACRSEIEENIERLSDTLCESDS